MLRKNRIILKTVVTASLVAFAVMVSARPGSAPNTHGSYDVFFDGAYTGTGHAAVGALRVASITGRVTDTASGATGNFKATNLATDNGHFKGSGTVLGIPMQICGRLEPADGKTIFTSRIMCSYVTVNATAGRAVGSK